MRIIRTDKQKDNLAKYGWDMSKVAVAALTIAPFTKSEAVDLKTVSVGLFAGVVLALLGYFLDGKEVKP